MNKAVVLLLTVSCAMSLPLRDLVKRHAEKRNSSNSDDEYLKLIRDEIFLQSGQPVSHGRVNAHNIADFFHTKLGLNSDLSNTLGRDYVINADINNDGMLNKHELLNAMRSLRILDMQHYL